MSIYLPIAGLSVDVYALLVLGGGVGFLSGMFGVGGGFLLTPFLMFMGIPPAVAVATATAGGMPMNIRNGVSRKPPPTPNIPDRKPTPPPSTSRA